MLKNKYLISLFLVGLCVFALIAVQFIWMADAFTLKKQQFNKEVHQALPQVAETFEEALFCHELYSNVQVNPGEGIQIFQKTWQPDSSGNNIWSKDTKDTINLYYTQSDSSLQQYDGLKFYYPSTIQLVMKINTWFDSTYVFNDGYVGIAQSTKGKTDIQSFKNLVGEHHNPKNLFEDYFLDSLIEEALIEAGISLKFQFGVYDQNNELVHSNGKSYLKELQKSSLQETLLKDNNFFNSYKLKIYFPDSSRYYLKGSILFLAVSLFIIAVLIFAFIIFARFILRQVELNEMKSNFVNNMTHEFKTPIANISLAVEHIEMMNGQIDEKTKKYIHIIQDENNRMITNVERILEVAKYHNKNEAHLNLETIFLDKLFTELLEQFSMSLQKINGKVKLNLVANNTKIIGDIFHLKNALSNVLDNAIKYNNKSIPEIEIAIKNHKNGLLIDIRDNGIGIDKKDLNRIFDPFFRRNTGNIHNIKGFGLGLSYVKRVIELHNGQINVHSSKDEGTTFSIFLPTKLNKQNYESEQIEYSVS